MRTKLFGYEMPTVTAIFEAYERQQTPRHNNRLSGGVIGKECERALWLQFRWAYEPTSFEGRMLRLFETGHRQEDRLVTDLRRAGVEVWDRDPDTGQQFTVTSHSGHYVGKLDGVARGLPEAPKAAHLFEAKTHNKKSFSALQSKGVEKSKPEHYAQMQSYMDLMGLTRALYLAVCKDDESLYAERIEIDAVYCASLRAKASRVIEAERPAPPIRDDDAAPPCMFCPAKGLCFERRWAPRNCRTCIHSTPEMDGDARWSCSLHKRNLSIDDQKAGCVQHLYVPDLVPGEQIDANPADGTITYRINGDVWMDGVETNPVSVSEPAAS